MIRIIVEPAPPGRWPLAVTEAITLETPGDWTLDHAITMCHRIDRMLHAAQATQ